MEPTVDRELPVFPLGSVVLPGVVVPLRIFEDRYCTLATDLSAPDSDRRFSTVMIERGSEVGGSDVRADIGCILETVAIRQHPDGTWDLAAAAISRMQVIRWLHDDPYPRAVTRPWPDDPGPEISRHDLSRLLESIRELCDGAAALGQAITLPDVARNSVSGALWKLCASLPMADLDRYRVLSAPSVEMRFDLLGGLVRQQLELLELISRQGHNPNG